MVRRVNAKRVLERRADGLTGRAIALAEGMSRKSWLEVFAADETGIGPDGHVNDSDPEIYGLRFPERNEHENAFVQSDCESVHKCTQRSPRKFWTRLRQDTNAC